MRRRHVRPPRGREDDHVYYKEENAIGPLWKGRRFPASACISGWAIQNRQPVAIEDVYADPRVPCEAYEPTFVKSLLMIPIRPTDPVGAIGAHWATKHRATPLEQELLQAVADAAATAVQNAELWSARARVEDELRRHARATETLLSVGNALASELEQEKLVQVITDEATKLCGAEFGAFFFNVINERGESYTLYTISGVPREKFAKFPLPRNTALFGPTFRGEGVVRLTDVTKDPRYGKNPPYHGMPNGHLPVCSYLAVPVKSRGGRTLGGLFFGHSREGMFTEEHERLTVGLAGQAAIALDNAGLYKELRESEERYRSLVAATTNVVWTTDASGAFVVPQPSWEAFTGQPWEEHRGFGWVDALHADDRPCVQAAWNKAVSDGALYESHGRVRHAPSQGYHHFEAKGVATRNTDGSIRGWIGTLVDVDARERAEEARRRVQVQMETIASNATLGLFMLDARQCLTFVNPAGERIMGFSFAECHGRPLHDVIHHTRPDGTPYPMEDCPIDRALPELSQMQGEDVFVRRDGSFYPVAFTASPIVEGGRPVGTVIEVRDITEEKRAEKALRDAIRARDVFLSIASHELRTPLTPLTLQLQGLVRMLQRDGESLESQTIVDKVTKAAKQVTHLDRLVKGLLDVSRLTEDRLVLEVEAVDLSQLVADALERLRPDIEPSGCQVSTEIAAGVVGMCDRLRLDQVVTNLVTNALKYGRGKPVLVALQADAERAVLSVQDHGIGVSVEDRRRIFGRFERAVSDRNYSGFGLGLWISRQVVEAMGGKIDLESQLGVGSTFRVELPLKPRGPQT